MRHPMPSPLTPVNLVHRVLRYPGLALYLVGVVLGYVWGHFWAGIRDGMLDAYRETE
jgi:hypothetical protein